MKPAVKGKCGWPLLAVIWLSGCVLYPAGIPGDQWLRMTPEQQQAIRMELARRDEMIRRRHDQEALPLATAQEQAAREGRKQRLRQAVPGDVLQCTLNDVEIAIARNIWRAANPVAVELLQGETRVLVLERSDKNHQQRSAMISFEHLNVRLCEVDGLRCNTLAGTSRDLQQGRQQRVKNKTVKGVLTCQYPPQFWHPG